MTKNQNKFILFLALAVLIITTAEGIFYYSSTLLTEPYFGLLLILQNSVKAFLFNPPISIENSMNALKNNPLPLFTLISYVYGLAVILAQFCTLSALASFASKLLKTRFFLRIKKQPKNFVFGSSIPAIRLLKNSSSKKQNLYLVADSELSDPDKMELSKNYVLTDQLNIAAEDEKKVEHWISNHHISKEDHFIFMYADPMDNLAAYSKINGIFENESENNKKKISGADNSPELLLAMPTQRFRSVVQSLMENRKGLKIFNLNELSILNMFDRHPLYSSAVSENRDIHMLIIGIGDMGEEVLRQTILLGTLNSSNRILIDIVDRKASVRKKQFQSMIHPSILDQKAEKNIIRIKDGICDGELTLRYTDFEVNSAPLIDILNKLGQDLPFTYSVIGLPGGADVLEAASCLYRVVREGGYTYSVPLAVHQDFEKLTEELVMSNSDGDVNEPLIIFQIDRNQLQIRHILNKEPERKCSEFHYQYELISSRISGILYGDTSNPKEQDPWTVWQNQSLYNQESTRWQQRNYKTAEAALTYYSGRSLEDLTAEISVNFFDKNGDFLSDLTKDDMLRLLEIPMYQEMCKMEHRRWNYYMILNGWYAGEKNKSLHRTPYLIPWDKLKESKPEIALYDLTPCILISRFSKEWSETGMEAEKGTNQGLPQLTEQPAR